LSDDKLPEGLPNWREYYDSGTESISHFNAQTEAKIDELLGKIVKSGREAGRDWISEEEELRLLLLKEGVNFHKISEVSVEATEHTNRSLSSRFSWNSANIGFSRSSS
jgi:hypothetical protein